MTKEYFISKLFLFHSFKHHLQTDKRWLKQAKSESLETILSQLKTLGNSVFDYYIGGLRVDEIIGEVFDFLDANDYIDRHKYIEWLSKNQGYREITLSDHSRWTLRFINRSDYIHVHPSRYSPYTIRMKANTLKTILCTLVLESDDDFKITVQKINKCRVEYLQLSPINENLFHSDLENKYALFCYK